MLKYNVFLQLNFFCTIHIIEAFVKRHESIVCYNNSSDYNTNNKKPRVFDIVAGSTVQVWCHFCNGKDDYNPKLWFFKKRYGLKQRIQDTQLNNNINKTAISPSHTMYIKEFNTDDSGFYTCRSYERGKGLIFSYVLEGVLYDEVIPKIGTTRQWADYKRTYIDSINTKFKLSEEEPYVRFRNAYGRYFYLYTVWDDWSVCKSINGNEKGTRNRTGRCRIGAVAVKTPKVTNDISDKITAYLSDRYDVPCRSLLLRDLVPEISKIIKRIPEFQAVEMCSVPQTEVKRDQFKKISMKKYRQQVMENSQATLVCTESLENSEIKWYKDKKLLQPINTMNKIEDEPHISIDEYNSLHLLRISKNDEGLYTCTINGKKVKEIEIIVTSKSKLLNQEFIRYSIYLGFVLSLTITCYCAGVCVAWHRRASFVDPLKLYKKGRRHSSKKEQEKLLIIRRCD